MAGMRALPAAIAVLLLLPATALAVEEQGTGANVRHVKNVPHTEKWNKTHQQGTDLEIATLTIAPDPVVAAAPKKAKPRKAKPRKRTRAKRRCRTVRSHGRRVRRCTRKRARGRKSDADPSTPGIQRTFAFAGSYYDGIDVVDVTDPVNAEKVANYDCGVGQGDVQILRRDGRVYVVYAQDDGYTQHSDSVCVKEAKVLGFNPVSGDGGSYIIDFTDPYHPHLVSFVAIAQGDSGWGSHNTTLHPSGRYLYNSNADLITNLLPAIEIVDISDLRTPKVVGEVALMTFPGIGTESHDISFNADGSRAYVAALSHGEILDTTDPANPKSLATIIDPAVNVWHQAEEVTIDGRSFLIAEDEFAGAEGTGTCPSGGVHVYDLTDETSPAKVGMFNIDQVGVAPGNDIENQYLARCTAHVFQIHREQKLMVMGWYNAGVRILDLSKLEAIRIGDLANVGDGIRQLGYYTFPDSDTWAAKTTKADRGGFYFFGNDKRRGLDVYEYKPTMGSRAPAGQWLTPAQALRRNERLRAAGPPKLAGICFLAARR